MGLRTVVVVCLAAWVGWLLVRGLMQRKVPWIGIAIVLVPLVWLFWTERQWVSAEQRFTAIARTLAPGSPGVHCQRFGEAFVYAGADLGHVSFEDGRPVGPAVVGYETCQRLAAYWRSSSEEKDSPSIDEVVAVHVLSHEAEHLAGVMAESRADCAAMQADAATAERLGATPEQGERLAQTYWRQVYPHMSDAYVTSECHADGPLDSTPGDGVWP